jgi:SCF-associated factor 1
MSMLDIPVEVFLDNLLPWLTVYSLLSLGCTNRFFASLCADDTFWKRKLLSDFNFSGIGTARTSGWKFIYKGLRNPRLFVWG